MLRAKTLVRALRVCDRANLTSQRTWRRSLPPLIVQRPAFWQQCRTFRSTAAALAVVRAGKDVPDLEDFPVERIRNFSIIAHVDHGKSTLADRLLESAGVIDKDGVKQYLDKLKVEKERGITVKAQTCTLFWKHDGQDYLINLIDTPGHVDFNYEVSRSLAACQGTLLLVDAVQGVQAQTVANFFLAFGNDLTIIPVINKVDLPHADTDRVVGQLQNLFDCEPDQVLKTSAKTGLGIDSVLPAVIERIPPPPGSRDAPFKAFLFDSWYDEYRGVICMVEVVDGILRKGDKIQSVHSGKAYEVMDVGIMHPEEVATGALYAGQVGYMTANMKASAEARVGDTFFAPGVPVTPLPGFKEAKPMVFAGIFPVDTGEHDNMQQALDKLTLNDSSVTVSKTRSTALGYGWRLGFLGILHMEVFQQRLEEEHGANVIATAPNVSYKAQMRDGTTVVVDAPDMFPSNLSQVEVFYEPTVNGTLICPSEHLGKMISLCEGKRGQQLEMTFIDETRVLLRYNLPTAEVVTDFYDQVKSLSSGYASFDYEEADYRPAPIRKLEILLNGTPVDALAAIVHADSATRVARDLCAALRDTIERQLYEIQIQAAIGSKIIARETIKAFRKQVTAKCYGGDISRKMKLLAKQKEGKKKMKMIGNVEVPKEAFRSIISRK